MSHPIYVDFDLTRAKYYSIKVTRKTDKKVKRIIESE